MKSLVAFYSLHGHTKVVGEKIAKKLGADIEVIKDKKDRHGLIGWFQSAFDEELKTQTKIEKPERKTTDYDLVVIGTPIWEGVVPPVKEYLQENKFKKVAFFVTFHASAENAGYVMGKIAKTNPLAVLELQDRQIAVGEAKQKIKEFCDEISSKIKS